MSDRWDWGGGHEVDQEASTAEELASLAEARTEELRSLVDAMPDVLLKLDADGEIEFANDAVEATLGFDPERLAGEPIEWLIATDGTDADAASIRERLTGDDADGDLELPLATAEGSVRHVRLTASAVGEGGTICVVRDISDRRRRERELEQYTELIQTVGDPMYVLDAGGQIEHVNDAMVRYTGYEREDLVGRAIGEIVPSREYDRAMERLVDVDDTDGRDSETFETALVTKDGELLLSEAKVTVLTDGDGEYAGSVGALRDIRERKRRERDLSLLKQVLTRVFRHNIRNELSVIQTNTELIDRHGDDRLAEYTEPILETCQRLLGHSEKARLLEQVIETDTLHETDVAATIHDLVGSAREEHPGASIDVDVPESTSVEAHPEIAKAIRELLENAIQHAPDDERPRVEIWTDETDDFLTLFIEDESGGLDDHEITVLREGAESDLEHGSGVGLWLVRWIVEYSDAEMIAHRTDEGSLMGIRFLRADRERGDEAGPARTESLFARAPLDVRDGSPDPFHGETVVGRREELHQLEDIYEDVERTGGHVALITGESGIGKTTVLAEFRKRLAGGDDPPLTATGRCKPGTTPPYYAFRKVMDGLPVATELQDLLARIATFDAGDPGSAKRNRQALFADIAEELRDLAIDRPVVLVVEDLHWADQVTIDLLEHLIEEVGRWALPILFLGTYRTGDVSERHPILEVIERTARTGRGTVLELEPFGPGDVRHLLASALELDAPAVPDEFVRAVHDLTGGNPLFVNEISHSLADRIGSQPDPEDLPGHLGEVSVGGSVESAISARIDALQAPVRSVLELGAVIGETISFDVLRTASDLAEADLVESVDRLVRDRIWNRTDGTIAFVHGVIRERTLERIDDERCERLHARVARAVETVHAGAIQEHYGRLATHYDRAGDDEAAADYYRQAGNRAADAYAHEDALDCYERAIALSRDREGTDPTELAALLADLAEVYRIVGEIDSSRTVATEGIAVAPDTSREACRLLGIVADARVAQGEFSQAREATDRQRELAVDLDARDLEARAIRRLGEIAKDRGGFDPAREFYEESLGIFRELDDRESEATVRKELGVVAWRQGEYDQARESLQRGLDIAQELDARQLEAACLNNLGGIAYNQDEYDRAHEFFRRSFGIDREIGSRRDEARSLNNLGLVARRQGEYDRAHAYYERSLDVKREMGDRQGEARTLNNLGVIATKQGEYDRAREYLLESLDIKRDIGDRNGETDSLGNLGMVAHRQGALDRAREYFEHGLDVAREVGDRRRECSALNNLGHAAVGLREYDRAREYFRDGLELARELGTPAEELRSLRGLGVIDRRQEEYDRATQHIRKALEVGADSGDPLELARVRLERARVALARGDVESARERRERAHETFAELGATHWEGQSDALRGQIAAVSGADETAREHWRTAVDTFEAIRAPQDALATLRDLVEACREQGDDDRGREWCRRARNLLADAPDPVAARHSEWVDRHETELEKA